MFLFCRHVVTGGSMRAWTKSPEGPQDLAMDSYEPSPDNDRLNLR